MSHLPKWRALVAMNADVLRPSANAFLKRHLTTCAICRDAWGRIRAFDVVAREVRRSPVPRFDLDPLALLREAGAEADTVARIGAFESLAADVRADESPTLDWDKVSAGVFAALASETAEPSAHGPTHEPKWRALLAYQEEALSDLGRKRVEKHLAACETCTEALAKMDAYDGVSEVIRKSEPVAVDFSKLELSVRREAKARARRRNASFGMLAMAAAVALALLVRGGDPAPVVRTIPGEQVAQQIESPPAAMLAATVVAVGGDARTEAGALEVGSVLHEAEVLHLVNGAVHARLEERTGFALHGDARLSLHRLREDGVELDLQGGRVSNQVKTGTVYAVRAGEFSIHVRGTLFEVARSGDAVAVTVDEGVVEVRRGDQVIALLPAPASWSSDDVLQPAERGTVRTPVATAAGAETWPVLTLPESQRIVRWELGDAAFEAVGGLAMRLPLGPSTLVGIDARGDRWVAEIEMLPEGLSIEESSLRLDRPRPAAGYLDPADIQAVVRPRIRNLQRCYERILRQAHPELEGSYALRVTVRRDGTVRRAAVVTDGDAPQRFVGCLQVEARRWVFPAPQGGPATFNLPLSFDIR